LQTILLLAKPFRVTSWQPYQEERVASARPVSGRQMRQLRTARIRTASRGDENVHPDRYTIIFLTTFASTFFFSLFSVIYRALHLAFPSFSSKT